MVRSIKREAKKLLIFSALCALIACSDDEVSKLEDSDFFPLVIGQYQIYEVSQTVYGITSKPIASNYFLKEKVVDSYQNISQSTIYKIERSIKKNATAAWQVDSVFTAQLLPDKAIRNENNLQYIKLFFPIQSKLSWNSNALNASEAAKATFQKLYEDFKIKDKTYQNTITVSYRNDSTLITRNKHSEVYAPKIGLIFKENTSLAYCQTTAACIGTGQIDSGKSFSMQLIESGKE